MSANQTLTLVVQLKDTQIHLDLDDKFGVREIQLEDDQPVRIRLYRARVCRGPDSLTVPCPLMDGEDELLAARFAILTVLYAYLAPWYWAKLMFQGDWTELTDQIYGGVPGYLEYLRSTVRFAQTHGEEIIQEVKETDFLDLDQLTGT